MYKMTKIAKLCKEYYIFVEHLGWVFYQSRKKRTRKQTIRQV
jgi:hypothetical protein